MPSSRFIPVLVMVVGCAEDPPAPDISDLRVAMRWQADETRSLDISIRNPDIPCDEVDEGFLGDSAVECKSTPWTLQVDGVDVTTTPVTCWSAHETLFGFAEKRCEGGTASVKLPEAETEHVEIIAKSDVDENRIVLFGVRYKYPFVQETTAQGGEPAVVRVDDLDLSAGNFTVVYSQAGNTVLRGGAFQSDAHRLQLSPHNLAAGTYQVRVLGVALQDKRTIAIPIEGALTVGP